MPRAGLNRDAVIDAASALADREGLDAVTLARLARHFAVSRTHLRRILADCVAAGLLERCGGDGEAFRVLPRLAQAVRRCLAMYLVHNADSVRRAFGDIAAPRAVA